MKSAVKEFKLIETVLDETWDTNLCNYCPLDEDHRGVRGHPNGYTSCEGSCCDEANDRALDEWDAVHLAGKDLEKLKSDIEKSWLFKVESFVLNIANKFGWFRNDCI